MIRLLVLILYVSPLTVAAPGDGEGLVSGAAGSDKCGCHRTRDHKHKRSSANVLPPILVQETLADYVRRVFVCRDETIDKYCSRIFRKYEKESDDDYVKRIDAIFQEFPWLISKDNVEFYSLTARYYRYKYRRLCSDRSEEQYSSRILQRLHGEDFNTYIQRMDCVYLAYPKLAIWGNIQFDKESTDWYTQRKAGCYGSVRPSLNVRESLVETYKRRKSEVDDNYSYFERICERRTGEGDSDYVQRMSRIQAKFRDLPLWYSIDYIDMIRDYYVLVYRKKDNEDLSHYYARLTYRSRNENLEIYVRRLALLEALFRYLSLWDNEDYLYLTKAYYRVLYSRYDGEGKVQYLKRVTATPYSENVDSYIKRMNIVRWVCKGSELFYDQKYLRYTKPYYEHFYKKGKETTDLWFERIFKRSFEETDDQYVKRVTMIRLVQGKETFAINETNIKYISEFYKLLFKRKKGEHLQAWLKRLKSKDMSEDETAYKTRLTFLANVYSDCKNTVKRIIGSGIQTIYGNSNTNQKCKSAKNKKTKENSGGDSGEEEDSSEEDNNERKYESSEEGSREGSSSEEDKLKCKSKSGKACKKKNNKKDNQKDTKNGKTVKIIDENKKAADSTKTKQTSCGATITEEEVKKTYARIDKETDETYFTRIVTKTSTSITKEEYVQIITLVRKTYPTLSLWYDKKYIELVREYYTAVYSQGSTECDEDYVRRLTERESWECSDEVHVQRLCLVYQLTVTATVWSEEKYYEKYTKKVYSAVYKKAESEDETTYFKRVVLKSAQETDIVYVRRVTLVWRTYSSLSLWTCESTFSIVKQFYSLKYTQGSGECEDTYVKRLTVRESWECSEELYVQRIHLVHLVTVSSTVWYEEKYYEKYTKTYYCVYYKKGEQESCSAWLTRVVTLLPGECEDNAIKRITLVKKEKSTCGCNCWTEDNFRKINSANVISTDYLTMIKKAFFMSDQKINVYEMKSTSSSSSSKTQSSSESEEEITIKN